MNILFLLSMAVLLIFCQGFPILSSPSFTQLSSFGDENKAWLFLKWNEVTSPDDADPVIGYKVKVWKVKPVKRQQHVFENGTLTQIEVEELPEINLKEDPSDELTIIDVPANTTQAKYSGVKIGATYEIGILAYTAKQEGDITSKMRIKSNKN